MATASSRKGICSLVKTGTRKLKTKASHKPYFDGIVVIKDKLLVIDDDACNLQLYNCHDGKLISTSHRLEFRPYGVCLISKTEVGVCLSDCTIIILPLKSIDDKKLVKTLNVRTKFDRCYSVAKVNSDILIVSGWKYDGMFCWGFVSIRDECLVLTHDICKGDIGCTHLAINENTIYISCLTSDSITTGVYAYDIFNPHKQKFLYQHQELEEPGSIMADRDCVYVCDYDRIHQLTDSGQLVTIHTVPSILEGLFYDDQHGLLYTTSYRSDDITVYKMEYLYQLGNTDIRDQILPQAHDVKAKTKRVPSRHYHSKGIPNEILEMDERSIQLFEEVLKDGKETVYSICIMVVGHMSGGKTTLVKRLLGEGVNISERHSTEGIDVYVNCCDVSLLTHEWTRRTKDSEQDYRLQRLVNVLNENYQTRDRVADSEQGGNFKQRERTDIKSMSHNADEDKNTEVLYNRSQEQNFGQNLLSTASQQEESHSTVVDTMPGSELGENVATENYKMDPLRKMLRLLQRNPFKANQDASKHVNLKILDFSGQYAFYSTHQMFLTGRAIYLLVSDASKEVSDFVEDEFYFDIEGEVKSKVHDHVEVWMNSIHSCAPPVNENLNSASSNTSSYTVLPPPVILVGTHIDQIPQRYRREHGQRHLKEIRSYLRDKPTSVHLVDEDFAIDNTVFDSKLEELKKKIVEVASQQPYWGEQIPTRWFLLEQQLLRLRDAGIKVISRSTLEKLNKEGTVRIEESEELDLFLKYLHETGTIIYFSIEVLRGNILLDPKWLIDALEPLISAHPNLPDSQADTQKWLDFKEKGILTLELVDALWTKENHPELHEHKEHILMIMEQLNIISRPRAFTENGEKVENYFLTPCMLRQDTPREIISPKQDPRMVSTPVLCYDFTGKFLPPPIFHRLIAACVAYWPVAKKKETSENLIFCDCCVFDLDLFHRLTLHYRNHIVFARITRLVIDGVKTPDAEMCTRVRKFITLNLSKITSYLGQNLQFELSTRWSPTQAVSADGRPPPFQMWFVDEGHYHDVPITPERLNYARLTAAVVTVCRNALSDILLTYFPVPYQDIYQVILANKVKLTEGRGRPLLNRDQSQVVFPDPQGETTGTVDHFDISLLYILIRNVSTVPAPITGWGINPLDQPRDCSIGASVEQIRFYRNCISGHSSDGKISQQDLEDYWNKIDAVLHDIEAVMGGKVYSQQFEKQKRQVVSMYEAC